MDLSKKKVCIIIPSLEKGGIQNYLIRFLDYIQENDFEFTIIYKSRKYKDNEYVIKPNYGNLLHKPLGYLNILNFSRYYYFFKKEKFDVILDFGGNFAGVPMLIGKLAGIPRRIAFYRRSSNAFHENILRKIYSIFINKLVLLFSTKILSNSSTALNFFFKNNFETNKFEVVWNGIDSSVFKPLNNKKKLRINYSLPINKLIIGHVGRFDVAKNHRTIFQVIKKLNDNYHFVFCGLNTDSSNFIMQCETLEIQDRVSFLGIQKNIPEILNTFDLFYFPSLTEGQPNALIEAIFCKIPVLTSNISSIKEVLGADFWHLLVEPQSVDQACESIEKKQYIILENKEFEKFRNKFEASLQFEKLKAILND